MQNNKNDKRLIVNADGFGFGPGATQAIFDAVRDGGFITSVSVNANFNDSERIKEFDSLFPHVSIGVHLNQLVGKPCLSPNKVPSLVNEEGYFHEHRFSILYHKGKINKAELIAELDAQISKIKDLVGSQLTHLDSQANLHLIYFDLFLEHARKWKINRMRNNASLICLEARNPQMARLKIYGTKMHVWLVHQYRKKQMLKARNKGMKMADALVTVGYAGYGNKTNIENWYNILNNLPAGTFEIYCHPAYPDAILKRWAKYNDERAKEFEILRNPSLAIAAKTAGVKLISFFEV